MQSFTGRPESSIENKPFFRFTQRKKTTSNQNPLKGLTANSELYTAMENGKLFQKINLDMTG